MRLIQAVTILKDEFLLLPMSNDANGFGSSSLSFKKNALVSQRSYIRFTINSNFISFDFSADCKDPGIPSNGERIGDNFNHGSQVAFFCMEGFALVGNPTSVCHRGNWSHALPNCKGTFVSSASWRRSVNIWRGHFAFALLLVEI